MQVYQRGCSLGDSLSPPGVFTGRFVLLVGFWESEAPAEPERVRFEEKWGALNSFPLSNPRGTNLRL